MSGYICIQRIFATDADKIEQAVERYPDGFSGGAAIVTFNGIYADNKEITDYGNYCSFFNSLKSKGIDIHVNLSSSIGHGDIQKNEPKPYPTMIDCDGNGCRDSACPRTDEFKNHLIETVKKYAALKPRVFWIDDDFRLSNHSPVDFGCFCDRCVSLFKSESGLDLTREDLKTAILKDDRINGKSVRKLWQEFNRRAIIELAHLISDTAHSFDDKMIIGFMQVSPEMSIYDLPDYKALIEVSKNKNGEVWFRHGSGFYGDADPYAVVDKNIAIARLCALTESSDGKIVKLTEEVTSPYTRRNKSMRLTLTEAVMNIGIGGADGVMDEAIKPNLDEQLMSDGIVALMHSSHAYLSTLKSLIKGKTQVGIYPYFDKDLWLYNDEKDSLSAMDDIGARYWRNLFYMGIPFTFRESGAKAILLSGKTVRAMGKNELDCWLKKGVYADGEAAIEINRITGKNMTGVKNAPYSLDDLSGAGTSEIFTSHSLNGETAGYNRYNIWGGSKNGAQCLTADSCEVLSYSMQERERKDGIIGMSYYINETGGKVAVSARGPWCDDILSKAKSTQIKNVLDALCGGRMPVRIESRNRVGVSVWEDKNERIVFIYNTDFDAADDIDMICDGEYTAEVLTASPNWQSLGCSDTIKIPTVEPWSNAVIRLKR
ncbi:MAG: hypothetical protein ACI4XH_03360 [Acutalibacteraceae bacterium]